MKQPNNPPRPIGRVGFVLQSMRGAWGWMIVTLVGTVLSVGFNFLTPQVIRVTGVSGTTSDRLCRRSRDFFGAGGSFDLSLPRIDVQKL